MQNNLSKISLSNVFLNKNASLQIYEWSYSSTKTSKVLLSPVMFSPSVIHASSSLKSSSSLQERRPVNVRISSPYPWQLVTRLEWLGVPKVGQCQRMNQVKACFLYLLKFRKSKRKENMLPWRTLEASLEAQLLLRSKSPLNSKKKRKLLRLTEELNVFFLVSGRLHCLA